MMLSYRQIIFALIIGSLLYSYFTRPPPREIIYHGKNDGSLRKFEKWKSTTMGENLAMRLWEIHGFKNNKDGIQDAQAKHLMKQLELIERTGRRVEYFCDIGFGMGSSSLLWLLYSPKTIVHTFDLTANKKAIEWLTNQFLGRFTYHEGDSKQTFRDFIQTYGNWCDVIMIDGDHTEQGLYDDIILGKQGSHTSSTIIIINGVFDTKNIHSAIKPTSFSPLTHEPSKALLRALDEHVIEKIPDLGPMCDVFLTSYGGSSGSYLGHCLTKYRE